MNKNLKRKLLRALRSGQYLQGQAALVSADGTQFCCLGVLADIQGCVWQEQKYGQLAPIMPRGRAPFNSDSTGNEGEGEYLKPRNAGGIPLHVQTRLAQMNDEGASFRKIADYIEKNL